MTITIDKTWNGGNGGNWNTAANWSPSGVPDFTNNVEILSGDDPFCTATWTHTTVDYVQVDTGAYWDFHNSAGNNIVVELLNNGTMHLDSTAGDGGSNITVNQPSGLIVNNGTVSIGNTTSTTDSRIWLGAESDLMTNNGTVNLYGGTSGNASFAAAHGVYLDNEGTISLFNGDTDSSSGTMYGGGSVYMNSGSELISLDGYTSTGHGTAGGGKVYFEGTTATHLHFGALGAISANGNFVDMLDFTVSGDKFDTGLTYANTTWAFTAGTGGGTMVYTDTNTGHTDTQWIGGVTSSASLSVSNNSGIMKVQHV